MSRPNARVSIERLTLQPDLVHVRHGLQVSEKSLTSDEFIESREKEADVRQFKRFIVGGTVSYGNLVGPWELVIDLRGNTVVVTSSAQCPCTSYGLYWMLERELPSWNHRRPLDHDRPLLHVYPGTDREPVYATTRDGQWLAAVLHQIRDAGGFVDVSFGPQFLRPAGLEEYERGIGMPTSAASPRQHG